MPRQGTRLHRWYADLPVGRNGELSKHTMTGGRDSCERRSSLIRQESRLASRPLKPEQKQWDTCYTVSADATVIPAESISDADD